MLGGDMTTEFFVATNLSPGMLARLERTRKGLRQTDVARLASVTQSEVSAFERGRYVIPAVRRSIYRALQLDREEP
jgi:transcriptional regulator with XRE-family HTH domain